MHMYIMDMHVGCMGSGCAFRCRLLVPPPCLHRVLFQFPSKFPLLPCYASGQMCSGPPGPLNIGILAGTTGPLPRPLPLPPQRFRPTCTLKEIIAKSHRHPYQLSLVHSQCLLVILPHMTSSPKSLLCPCWFPTGPSLLLPRGPAHTLQYLLPFWARTSLLPGIATLSLDCPRSCSVLHVCRMLLSFEQP